MNIEGKVFLLGTGLGVQFVIIFKEKCQRIRISRDENKQYHMRRKRRFGDWLFAFEILISDVILGVLSNRAVNLTF